MISQVTGYTNSLEFPVAMGAFQTVLTNQPLFGTDAFVLVLHLFYFKHVALSLPLTYGITKTVCLDHYQEDHRPQRLRAAVVTGHFHLGGITIA
jgi:hypothetical protein